MIKECPKCKKQAIWQSLLVVTQSEGPAAKKKWYINCDHCGYKKYENQ